MLTIDVHPVDSQPGDYPKGQAVAVSSLPDCDICRHVESRIRPERALYDGKTEFGSWANMCHPHMLTFGVGLGTGKGQRLVIPGIDKAVEDHPAGSGR